MVQETNSVREVSTQRRQILDLRRIWQHSDVLISCRHLYTDFLAIFVTLPKISGFRSGTVVMISYIVKFALALVCDLSESTRRGLLPKQVDCFFRRLTKQLQLATKENVLSHVT